MKLGAVLKAIINPVYRLFQPIYVEGLENFDMEKGFILCANHISNWDVVALYLACPRLINFMAKAELFKFKPFGWLLKKLGAFPVRRGENDITAIKTAMKVLKDSEVLGIFPQGTRGSDDDQAKGGAVLIASKTNVPIVPAAIIADYKIFHPVRIIMGEPVDVSADHRLTGEEIQQKADEIMQKIITLKTGAKIYG
ncbi:MAG: 1-acyl-sn-glycerol-3-phosphate acyltransferase [Clostridia bacterium]|nr:1-acyl-sn-glycerol-3-phosphate acyltransferase [Clostridia bacterium]